MKRALVVAVVVGATVVGASVAEAAIQKGTFTGKTTAGDPVGLTVVKKNRVADFYFETVHLTCSDGDQFDTGKGSNRLQSPAGKRYTVSSKRKFSIKDHNDQAGNGWDVKGKFTSDGSQVTGTLSVFATFDTSNNATPNGSVKCKSANLKFTAKRK
jgi:hypothetical protein